MMTARFSDGGAPSFDDSLIRALNLEGSTANVGKEAVCSAGFEDDEGLVYRVVVCYSKEDCSRLLKVAEQQGLERRGSVPGIDHVFGAPHRLR